MVILFITQTGYIISIIYDSEVTIMFIIQKPHAKANVSKTIRFTEDLNNQIIEVAHKEDVSFNELVIQCCQFALNHYQMTDPEEKTGEPNRHQ